MECRERRSATRRGRPVLVLAVLPSHDDYIVYMYWARELCAESEKLARESRVREGRGRFHPHTIHTQASQKVLLSGWVGCRSVLLIFPGTSILSFLDPFGTRVEATDARWRSH